MSIHKLDEPINLIHADLNPIVRARATQLEPDRRERVVIAREGHQALGAAPTDLNDQRPGNAPC